MDYQTLETMMQSPETIAIGVGAIAGSIGAVAGYLTGRYTSNLRLKQSQLNREVRIEEERTKQAEYETLREQAKTDVEKSRSGVELKKLDYENANAEHQRKLELTARERECKLEDGKTAYERQKEQTETQTHEAEKQRDYDAKQEELNRATKLKQTIETSERLRPVLEEYIEALKQPSGETPDLDYEMQREKYRKELVEEVIEKYENKEGFINELDGGNDVFDPEGELVENINHIVDAKFPLKQSANRAPIQLRTDLEKLIKFLGL